MCTDCGCQTANQQAMAHIHKPHNAQGHRHDKSSTRHITIESNIFGKNDEIAQKNRQWFEDNHIKVVNIMSSPGAGKTTLLEKTLRYLSRKMNVAVIVGDQHTNNDAKRLEGLGARVYQINTLSACHLDAQMIADAIVSFVPKDIDLLIIENVGNLVCPASFDLGEHKKVALLSTPEGEDKPAKYPVLFHGADIVLITKTDLIPHLQWSLKQTLEQIRAVNPDAKSLTVSSLYGQGLSAWIEYLSHDVLEHAECV